jgi:hypothetical protein
MGASPCGFESHPRHHVVKDAQESLTERCGFSVMAAVMVLLLATSCGGPTSHRDGEGPLSSLGDAGGSTQMTVARVPGVDTWSC